MDADEYLERLEGKIRKCLFFYVLIFKKKHCVSINNERDYKGKDRVIHMYYPTWDSRVLQINTWFMFWAIKTRSVYSIKTDSKCPIDLVNFMLQNTLVDHCQEN